MYERATEQNTSKAKRIVLVEPDQLRMIAERLERTPVLHGEVALYDLTNTITLAAIPKYEERPQLGECHE